MDQMTSTSQPQPPEEASTGGTSVTIARAEGGTFTVDGKPAQTLDEALQMARQALEASEGDSRMSVEEAFRGGFNGGSGVPGDMGAGY